MSEPEDIASSAYRRAAVRASLQLAEMVGAVAVCLGALWVGWRLLSMLPEAWQIGLAFGIIALVCVSLAWLYLFLRHLVGHAGDGREERRG